METVKINENISLNYIKMTKLKTTSVGVFIHRPLNKDEASLNALLPMVLKSGCEQYPTREDIAIRLDELYGGTMGATVMKFGEDQAIYFDAETISDKYTPNGEKLTSELMSLLMSVIFAPKVCNGAFDKTIVEQEKKDAADRIDAFVNDKRQYASSRCQQETARGTDFEIMRFGDKESLLKIDQTQLYDYYKSIIGSSVIDLFVCGDADIECIEQTVKEYTKGIEFMQARITKTDILRRDISRINKITERMDVAQGKLAMGFLTNIQPQDKDYYALAVFNSIFGAGTHSKLFNNVREKLSLAYYASSQIDKFKGILVVNAGIEFDKYEKVYDEVLAQLENIKNGEISEHEFSSSITTIVNTCNSYYDDQRALVIFMLSQSVMGSNVSIAEYIENIKKVTVDDVKSVANNIQLDTVYFLAGKEVV